MNISFLEDLKRITKAKTVVKKEVIQSLWSGYGEIIRLEIDYGVQPPLILKQIDLSANVNHPRGWNTDLSHLRKVKSYVVETYWYQHFANEKEYSFRIPKGVWTHFEKHQQVILMEDLDFSGYPVRNTHLSINEIKGVLKWLAQFHGEFLNQKPTGLWNEGTYWHLDTRPDEWTEMANSELKEFANVISEELKFSKYQTIIHGDAKLANFCFSKDSKNVAAVDFQYVGGGCGMKDVAYFIGSCLNEDDCQKYESEILEYYFQELKIVASISVPEFRELEMEWRRLYSWAWADFTRFLFGWMPTHQKLNGYTKLMVNLVLDEIKTRK